jgi:peptidoglycan/LPS O-acetylase OafA/YrhL
MTSFETTAYSSQEMHKDRIFGLDVMRAIAILCVTLSHGFLAQNLHNLIDNVFVFLKPVASLCNLTWHFGLLGVEIFFVLSGFLIGGILLRTLSESEQKPLGWSHLILFYGRRWFRTLPLFWLCLGINIFFEYALRERIFTLPTILGETFFLNNIKEIHVDFMPESWSLAVEEWFYLIFPLVLWVGYLFWPRSKERVFITSAAILFLSSLVLRIHGAYLPGSDFVNSQRCAVIYRFDALMTGVFAAWIYMRFPRIWKDKALICALLGILFLGLGYGGLFTWVDSGITISPDTFFAKTFRFNIISCGAALLLPAASLWKVKSTNGLTSLISKLALYSYALYLVNWPLFQLFMTPRFANWNSVWWKALILFFLKQILAYLLARLLYHSYESRITRLRDKLPLWLGLVKKTT